MCDAHVDCEGEVARDLGIDVPTHVVALEVRVAQDTVLVHQTDARIVFHLVRTARHRDVVLVRQTELLVDLRQPVRVAQNAHLLHPGQILRRPVGGQVVQLAGLVVPVDVVLGVEHLGHGGVLREGDRAVVGDRGEALRSRLGGDQNHAVGSAHAVDGGRCGVLEHRHRGDVVRVEVVEGALHTVDDAQRARIVEGAEAAHEQGRGVAARSTRALDAGHTGQTARQHALEVRARGLHDILARDLRNGTDHELLFLRAVSDDHDLVDFGGILLHLYVDAGASRDGDFNCFVAQIREDERSIRRRDLDRVVSFRIGGGTRCRVLLDDDRDSDLAPSLGSGNQTGDLKGLRLDAGSPCEQAGQHEQGGPGHPLPVACSVKFFHRSRLIGLIHGQI